MPIKKLNYIRKIMINWIIN